MISIIIPAFNEEENIQKLLGFLNQHIQTGETEIIVVDGGSQDSTVHVAKKQGAKVVISPKKGRANQMNYGAEKAKGNWLYFLHADTTPPPTFIKDIHQKINDGYACGCFRLSFDDHHPALRFFAWFTRFDINFFRFGDQSLFVSRTFFEQINGFNERQLVMEDQEIVSRLKKHAQFGIIKKPVVTSARKYRQVGIFKLQLVFMIIVVLYYLNISQETMMHFYKMCISDSNCCSG